MNLKSRKNLKAFTCMLEKTVELREVSNQSNWHLKALKIIGWFQDEGDPVLPDEPAEVPLWPAAVSADAREL